MKLFLCGHDYQYAVEQSLLTFFPAERPEYVDREPKSGDHIAVKVSQGPVWTTASVRIVYGGKTARASSRFRTDAPVGEWEADRARRKAVKLAFYRAYVSLSGDRPVWGSLTGVRPGKVAEASMRRGVTPAQEEKRLVRELFVAPDRAKMCVAAALEGIRAADRLQKKDVCLYIGVPFCPTRCAYCSFVSQSVEKSMALIPPFLEALRRETLAAAEAADRAGLRVVSVYVGGGTPTTLSDKQLAEMLALVRREFGIERGVEWTVEAGRPDTVTPEKLAAMLGAGVTRVSVNPQTMENRVLEAIGRRHTAEDTLRAYRQAREAGFCEINMDMIAGLPADTPEGFRRSLDAVLALSPENITVHTLALKRGSAITLEKAGIPGGTEVREMLAYASKKLPRAGYEPYYLYRQKFMSGGFENVGWQKGHTGNLYNVCIMEELCTVLALGGGASTKLVDAGTGLIERVFNPKYPKEYIERIDGIIDSKKRITEFYKGGDEA